MFFVVIKHYIILGVHFPFYLSPINCIITQQHGVVIMELPKRKPTRMQGFDYSTPGMYFVTVCTKEKRHLLGKIVGFGVYDEPKMTLSEYGKILDKHIKLMDEKYPHIKVHKYIVMPNHFHMILYITERKGGSSASAEPYNNETSKFVSLLKRFCNREIGKNIWQSHFHDHIIRGERDYQKIWQYIDSNVICWEKDCFYDTSAE